MKQFIFIVISSLILSLASFESAHAQRAVEADNFEAKAAAKAARAQKAPKATKAPIAPKTKKANLVSTSSSVTNIPSSSPVAVYARLVKRQNEINASLQALSTNLSALKGGKAKKARQQIDLLQTENKAITTQISLLPRTAKDPQYALEIEQQEKQAYKQHLQQESDELIKTIDPYAGQLSPDPELQQAYREYIAINIQNEQFNSGDLEFRVMFAIAKKPLAKSAIKLTPVLTQKLPNGSTAYYYGNFKSKEDAQNACNKILAEGRYRDAFVVAMVGDKRVPMPK